MSTDRKIRASRENGAKSRGPVTLEGRLKSSANSARHHLLSKTILVENERPEAFADLLAGLTREFNPQTETQRALVETMAVSRWRQMRIWALERATLQSAMEAHNPNQVDPATRVALAFRNLADDSRTLDLLHRYETRFDRQFTRSLNLLMKLASPDNPLSRTGLPACPSAEGAPSPAQNDFCQTNPSDADPSGGDLTGAGLPACAPPPESDAHLPICALASGEDLPPRAPGAHEEAPQRTPAPAREASLAHFPTFVMDITLRTPEQTGLPPDRSRFAANRVTAAAAAKSILNK